MENKEVQLPLFETIGLIMANHAYDDPKKHSVITYDDLLFFKYLLNVGLKQEFEEQPSLPTLTIMGTVKDEEENRLARQNFKYYDYMNHNSYANGKIMPEYSEVVELYEQLCQKKAQKPSAKLYGGALQNEVMVSVSLDNYAETIEKYGKDYDSETLIRALKEVTKYERYKFWTDSYVLNPKTNSRDLFVNHTHEIFDIGLRKIADKIAETNPHLNKNRIKKAIIKSVTRFDALGLIEDNIKFSTKLLDKKKEEDLAQSLEKQK